nr:hypothetical protein [Demequina litorisediminis]
MPSTRLTRVRAAIAVALAALVAVAVAPAASAHTELTESTPSDGQTVALLDEVSLTFSSPLLDIGSEPQHRRCRGCRSRAGAHVPRHDHHFRARRREPPRGRRPVGVAHRRRGRPSHRGRHRLHVRPRGGRCDGHRHR